jgi:hypothetical protein
MITYEQDPDVFRWGLELFDADPFTNCQYCDTPSPNEPHYYHHHYYKNDQYNSVGCSSLQSDELLAHSLQEELSQLSVSETPSIERAAEDSELPYYPHDWQGHHPAENYTFGHDKCSEECDDMDRCSSCSSPERNYCTEEWSYSLDWADEYALDGEVGKSMSPESMEKYLQWMRQL